MMLEGTTRTWLKSLPTNSVGSWAELKHRFIQNFKDTCKQPMSIVDLAACVQEEGESTTHWVKRVSAILHSSDRIIADTAMLTLEGNCSFKPLKYKLGRLKCHCNDMSSLMAALVKYADSDKYQGSGFRGGQQLESQTKRIRSLAFETLAIPITTRRRLLPSSKGPN